MKTYGGVEVYSSTILDLGTRWWAVNSTTRPLYPRRKSPQCPFDRGLSGPRSGLDAVEIKSCPYLESNPGHPARRSTDCAMPTFPPPHECKKIHQHSHTVSHIRRTARITSHPSPMQITPSIYPTESIIQTLIQETTQLYIHHSYGTLN
jgi:hypothetical protein